jgi:PEP-CTERM motif
MKKVLYASIMASAYVVAAAPLHASLIGSQVTATVDSPTQGNARTVPVTQTVGAGVEFPSGTLELLSSGVPSGTFIIGVNIDVGASTIDLHYTESATATSATFNGYVFDFDSSSPIITGVSLDALSTFTAGQVPLGFGPHEVTINVEGLNFTSSSRILVDINTPGVSSVPEPNSYGLMLTGLGVLGFAMWRRAGFCFLRS